MDVAAHRGERSSVRRLGNIDPATHLVDAERA
jgi:hypothetical protein